MKDKMGGKLFAAGISLVMAIVLLGTGTFAWFTVGTKAEVEGISISFNSDEAWPFEVSLDYDKLGENATWEKELAITPTLTASGTHLPEEFLLRPITTYDLQNWYITGYDAFGNTAGFMKVKLEDVANQRNTYGVDAEREETENYLYYVDVWVRTRNPNNTYDLRLNNPGYLDGALYTNDWETDYGTYVLWKPVWDSGKTPAGYTTENNAMASARVGFLTYDDDDQPYSYYIYEPNADLHSGLGTVDAGKAELTYINGQTEDDGLLVKNYNAAATNGEFKTTMVPYASGTDAGYVLAQQQTVKQQKSQWKSTVLNSTSPIETWNSECIGSIGNFYDKNGNLVSDFATQLPAIAEKIDKDHICHIRIFFWLEGQDVDCWNQIAGGNLYANLEFRGDITTPRATQTDLPDPATPTDVPTPTDLATPTDPIPGS